MYLDDSGDAGMKFDSGSSRFLVMAACVFTETIHIDEVAAAINDCSARHRQSREFKYSKTKERIKDDFFERVAHGTFSVRAIAIDKSRLRSRHLIEHPNDLKAYAVMQLLTHSFGEIRGAKLFVDGQDTRGFQMSNATYFRERVNREVAGTIRAVEFADSKQNVMIQLADMIAGAIGRHIREDDRQNSRHFDTFRRRTWQPRGTLWRFR